MLNFKQQNSIQTLNFVLKQQFGKKKGSSKRWMQEHLNDHYVKEAVKKGYRSRAAFKLIEMQQRYKIIKPQQTILDLGSAPGGWTQMAVKFSQADKGLQKDEKKRVLAIDRLDMEPVQGAHFYKGDLTDEKTRLFIPEYFDMQPVDVLISDMAPNFCGDLDLDHHNINILNQICLDIAKQSLKPGGTLLMKNLQGALENQYFKNYKTFFKDFQRVKPQSSRSRSSEIYYLGKGFKMSKQYFINQKFEKKIEENSQDIVTEEEMSLEEQAQFKKITIEFLKKQVRLGNKLDGKDIDELQQMEFLQDEFNDWDKLRKGDKTKQNQAPEDDIKSNSEKLEEFKEDTRAIFGEDSLTFNTKKKDFFEELDQIQEEFKNISEQEQQINAMNSQGKKGDEGLLLPEEELHPQDQKIKEEEMFKRYASLFSSAQQKLDYMNQSEEEEKQNKLIDKGGLDSDMDKLADSGTLDLIKEKVKNIEEIKLMEGLKQKDMQGDQVNQFQSDESFEEAMKQGKELGLTQEQLALMWEEYNETQDILTREKVNTAEEFLALKQKKDQYKGGKQKVKEFDKLFRDFDK